MKQLESALDVCKEELALYLSRTEENKEMFENQLKKKSKEVKACFGNFSVLQKKLLFWLLYPEILRNVKQNLCSVSCDCELSWEEILYILWWSRGKA